MQIKIEKNYLWFPVDLSEEEKQLDIYLEGTQIHELQISLGVKHCDFYAALNVRAYRGRILTLESQAGEAALSSGLIRMEEERPENPYPFRPKLHYTPAFGWVNDPNGLVYHDGVYHLFYQHNPYSVRWQNMSWGHAVSTDLFHWEEKDIALSPDELGTVYSGCGFVDKKNAAGFGDHALLFFYTAAGGRNEWSEREGNRFTQRLCWSDDNAVTMHKCEKEILSWIVDENRDPKVFWHEASRAYIMVLYLTENKFRIYRSDNLLDWELTQNMCVEGMWECPLLMEVAVEDSNEKKWVFWSADGYYQIGSFDGYQFTPETKRQMAYVSRRPYAAQDYSNTGDRTLLVPWLRLDSERGWYHGAMGIPQELTIRKTKEGPRIAIQMPSELAGLRGSWEPLTEGTPAAIGDKARELQVQWGAAAAGKAELTIGESLLLIDFEKGILEVKPACRYELDTETRAFFDPAEGLKLTVVIDQEILEIIGQDGLISATTETEENVLGKEILLRTDNATEKYGWYALDPV